MVNSNTVNSKFHFIRSFCEMFCYYFAIISCLKCTVNSYFHLIQGKSLPRNDFELTVPDLDMVDLVHDSMQGHEIKKILIPGAPPFGSATDSWGFPAGNWGGGAAKERACFTAARTPPPP